MAEEQGGSGRRPQIDGLRAIAMVGVLYVHLYDTDPTLENSRVNLFFVVSGYLITLSLLSARNRGAAGGVLNFYARRLLRLMPPLLIALFVACLYDRMFIQPSILWHIGQLSNVYFYLSNSWDPWVTAHLWSLNVLEQYYLFWPLLILYVPIRFIFLIVIGLCIVPFFLRAGLPRLAPDVMAIRVLPFYVFDAIAAGALVALLEHQRSRLFDIIAKPWVGMVATVVVAATILSERYVGASELVRLASIASIACIVTGASRGYSGIAGSLLSSRPMSYLGTISYSMYIYHIFIWWIIADRVPALYVPGWLPFVVVSSITVLLSALSWHWLEAPINRLKVHFPT